MGDPDQVAESARKPTAVRMANAFGHFWWEFLIGDTPEIFIGTGVIIGLVALLCLDRSVRTVSAVVFPLLVVSLLGASVRRAGRRRS
jgi:hypothetical protein